MTGAGGGRAIDYLFLFFLINFNVWLILKRWFLTYVIDVLAVRMECRVLRCFGWNGTLTEVSRADSRTAFKHISYLWMALSRPRNKACKILDKLTGERYHHIPVLAASIRVCGCFIFFSSSLGSSFGNRKPLREA